MAALFPFLFDDDNNSEIYEDILRQLQPVAREVFRIADNPGSRPPLHGTTAGSDRSTASHDDHESVILSEELFKLILQEDDGTQVWQGERQASDPSTQPPELYGLPYNPFKSQAFLNAGTTSQSDRELSSVLQQEEWESPSIDGNVVPNDSYLAQALSDDGIRFLSMSDREISRMLQEEEWETPGVLGNDENPSGSQSVPSIPNIWNSQLSDEELIRQIQEEEWGAATSASISPSSRNSSCREATPVMAPTAEPPKCSICLVEFEAGDEKRHLPCMHGFHKNCVDRWLEIRTSCPVCRREVDPHD